MGGAAKGWGMRGCRARGFPSWARSLEDLFDVIYLIE